MVTFFYIFRYILTRGYWLDLIGKIMRYWTENNIYCHLVWKTKQYLFCFEYNVFKPFPVSPGNFRSAYLSYLSELSFEHIGSEQCVFIVCFFFFISFFFVIHILPFIPHKHFRVYFRLNKLNKWIMLRLWYIEQRNLPVKCQSPALSNVIF